MNKAAAPLVMSTGQREALTVLSRSRSRSWTATRRQVKRAMVVLMAADGAANSQIAATVGVTRVTLRSWRTRFAQEGPGQVLGGPRRSRPQAGDLAGDGPGDRSPDSARKAFRGNALELLVDQEQGRPPPPATTEGRPPPPPATTEGRPPPPPATTE